MLTLLLLQAASGTAPEPPLTAQRAAGFEDTTFSLLNPVPRELMRDISADRPDTTESPISVDAGHIQLEISIGDWTRERRDDAVTLMQSNVKFGLSQNTDIQFVFDSWVLEDNRAGGNVDGFGDVQIRLKHNLWGNDGETEDAFALFPYIKVPTGTVRSTDRLEGGLILPYSRPLTDTLDLGLMAQFDAVYDDAQQEHNLEFLHTAVLGYPIFGEVGGYLEYVGIAAEGGEYTYSANIGVTHQPGPDLIWDVGTRVGLSDELDDLGLFLGFTYRF